MKDRDHDLPPELEQQWREWAGIEPSLDEQQIKRNLLDRTPDRRSRPRRRLVLVAAAASLLAALIGFESIRRPQAPVASVEPAIVHETGEGVILILREGKEPIYVLTEPAPNGEGVER
jgi:ferric-dicitrate binding protein FerR (iron transport regulator)